MDSVYKRFCFDMHRTSCIVKFTVSIITRSTWLIPLQRWFEYEMPLILDIEFVFLQYIILCFEHGKNARVY